MVEISGLKEHDPDFPNVGQLREALQQMGGREIWTGDHMKNIWVNEFLKIFFGNGGIETDASTQIGPNFWMLV